MDIVSITVKRMVHTRRVRLVPLTCALFVAGTPSTGRAQEAPADLLGCYEVEEGAWVAHTDPRRGTTRTLPNLMSDSTDYQVPPRIELTDTLGRRLTRNMWVVETPEGALTTPRSFRAWRAAGDSILLHFANGFHGVVAVVRRAGRSLRGDVWTSSDAFIRDGGVQGYRRPITLTPVDCGSPSPIADADLDTPLRAVERRRR